MYDTITLETDARGVSVLTLNRPDKHNALSGQMMADLIDAMAALDRDPAVRVVVLAAAGRSFCAGGDLAWMQDQMAADPDTRRAGARRLAEMLQAMNTLSKPLVGQVHGNAFGGGVGVMSVCDVAVAADTARFGLTETRLGLIPATIGPYVLARLGEGAARRVFGSARLFDADEAVALGLAARAVPPGDLAAAVEAEVAPYLACAPGAVAAAKAMTRALGPVIDDRVIDWSVDQLIARWESPEAAEGIAAFFDRRPPGWAGG